MTSPDLFEQAVAEAERQQKNETAAHGAAEPVADPLEHRELEGLMVIQGPVDPVTLVDGQTLNDVVFWANQKGIVIPRNECGDSIAGFNRVLQAENNETIESRASWPYLIVVPQQPTNILDLQKMLDENGLVPATIREFISYDWRSRTTPTLSSLVCLGTIVPGGMGDAIASLYPATSFGNVLDKLPVSPWVTTFSSRQGILVRIKTDVSSTTP